MKKLLCLILCAFLCFSAIGCAGMGTKPSQTMTITKSERCKTFDDINKIDKVLNTISQIEKGEIVSDADVNWQYKIELTVDESKLSYYVGTVFVDADGTKYKVLNLSEIITKLNGIYNEIDAEETAYK